MWLTVGTYAAVWIAGTWFGATAMSLLMISGRRGGYSESERRIQSLLPLPESWNPTPRRLYWYGEPPTGEHFSSGTPTGTSSG